ncbi:MAG: hypothetical protein K2L72_02860, partial [Clostridia bacterium]|nr:hypothetical protein [Clostridia bacterium]
SAGSKKVKDVTVSIDFADRTAPTINYSDDLPKFFIKGNTYKMPSYTLSGDYDRTKCWAKVFHVAEDKTETEVDIASNSFKVEHSSGSYAIRIHVEDAAGNPNDYEYVRKVDGPETVVEHKVLYFDEEFGERQVSLFEDKYTGGFVSKDTDDAHVYGDEAGAYKIEFDGETPTTYNEGIIIMDVPAVNNISDYEDIYLYVYNDSDKDIIMGSRWWNDTTVKKGQWTKLTWNTRAWGNNTSPINGRPVGVANITNMSIRFIFDYDQEIIPNGTFYLSAMYGTPKIESQIEIGENVDIAGGTHYINDVINLNAAEIEGKTVDYYKVDGVIIAGDSFTVTKESHRVEVFYQEGELTADNMTWAAPEEFELVDGEVQIHYMGTDENWVMSYDVYGVNEGWKYFGAYVGGANQLVGVELIDETHSKFSGYGGAWKWDKGVQLSSEVYNLLRAATEENPVKAVYVRRGNEIRGYVISGGKTYLLGAVEFSTFEISGNNFGYGARRPGKNIPDPATVKNFKAVAGETKTNLYFFNGAFDATLTIDGEAQSGTYYLGDKISLTAAPAPEGKMFAYFKVNGVRIEGNEGVITATDTVVETVYEDKSTLTLADGVKTEDGRTGTVDVAKNSYVVLDYTGKAPAGKYFIGFTVDGENVEGYRILVTGDAHEIGVQFADKIQTGNDKLNDITDTTDVIYAINDDGDEHWKPASIEHVTDFIFDGSDGAVDENSVIKIVTGSDSGENSFAFSSALVENLDDYKEIYFYVYTNASGLKAGGWWCGDTDLVAGKWTRVSFRREADPKENPHDIIGNGTGIVWDAGISKFAYRIFNAPANATVYVTAVYGVPYADVEVTVQDSVKDYITVSGTFKEGQTVTLSHHGAPEGQAFAYFTVDGERYDGHTYTLGTQEVIFGAVFSEISRITLGNGVTTEDGETEYGRGAEVTLKLDAASAPADKLFNYFTVDGQRIVGDTFVTTGQAHTVEAVFVSSAADLTWIKDEEAVDAKSHSYNWSNNYYKFTGAALGEATSWALEANAYGFDNLGSAWYSLDFLVGNNATLQIRLHSAGNAAIYAMGANHKDGSVLKNLDGSVITACKAATAEKPVKFTAVRDGSDYYILFNGELLLKTQFEFNTDDETFGIGGTDCDTWLTTHPTATYSYRTGDEIAEYVTSVKMTGENVTFDNADGVYRLGDTVTMTAAAAEEGEKFVRFTVNDSPVEGSTFVVTALGTYTVKAEYAEISTLNLGTGVETADGETEYGRGATVTLIFSGVLQDGEVFDCFKVDGVKIKDDKFVTSAGTHTIEAVIITSADDLTWKETEYEEPDKTISDWGAYKKLDSAANWVLSYDMTATNAKTVNAGIPNAWFAGVLFRDNQIIGYQMGENNGYANFIGSAGSGAGTTWDKFSDSLASLASLLNGASKENPVTLIFVRQGNTFSSYFKVDCKLYVAVENKTHSALSTEYGLDFGYGWRVGGDTGGNPDIENIKWVTGAEKVGLYVNSLNAVNGQTSETQINNIYGAEVISGTATLEYVTDIPTGLSDENVKERGVMKVSATNDELALNVKNVFISDLNDYGEIYFWVYLEDENANGVQAGTYWCANTNLVANQWTKIRVTRDTNWAWVNGTGAVNNGVPTGVGGQKVYEVGSQVFAYRLMNGNGKTFYVSSLYGVPKENLAEDKTTSYSVVGGDDELTGILNDNFFPHAE